MKLKKELLVNVLNSVKELSSEASFGFTDVGIEMILMDPANVAMLCATIKKDNIEDYEVTKEKVRFNVMDLYKSLQKLPKEVCFKVDNDKVIIGSSDLKKSFKLPIIEDDSNEQKKPCLYFGVEVDISTEEFVNIIESSVTVSDSVRFSTKALNLNVVAEGDIKSYNATAETTAIRVDKESSAKYSLDYLNKFMKSKKVSDNITFKFNTDYPLMLLLSNNEIDLEFILAPKKEDY
jgi:DNA polymerase III sliding clamp (beta) subunit (PCNA family)